jgi:hypothetical protein
MRRRRIASTVAVSAWILMTGIALAQQDRSSPESWRGEAAVRAHDPAVRFAQYEPRRRIRRAPTEQHSSAFSSPAYGPTPRAGSCPAPYKEAFGACVSQCPGGFEDRGSFCNFIKGN